MRKKWAKYEAMVTCRMSSQLKRDLQRYAKDQGLSTTETLRLILQAWLEDEFDDNNADEDEKTP